MIFRGDLYLIPNSVFINEPAISGIRKYFSSPDLYRSLEGPFSFRNEEDTFRFRVLGGIHYLDFGSNVIPFKKK